MNKTNLKMVGRGIEESPREFRYAMGYQILQMIKINRYLKI